MLPQIAGQEEIFVVADNGEASEEFLCQTPSIGKRLWFLDGYVARDRSTVPVQRTMTFQSEDASKYFNDLPDAYLDISFDEALKKNGVALADGPRRYCRLGLLNVTSERQSVHQIVPCNEPWRA